MKELALCEEFGVTTDNGVPVTSSRKIAERFGKRHADVLRDIEAHLISADLRSLNWIRKTTYVDERGREQPCYLLTRNGFMFVVSAYTGDDIARLKIAYFLAFDAMESALHGLEGPAWPEAFHWLRQQIGDIKTTVCATHSEVKKTGENIVEIRQVIKNRRREITDATKAIHVDAVDYLGGICPADSHTKIVETGRRIPGKSEFDHFYQNSKPDPDHTWLISIEMHAKLTTGRISRDQLEGAFRLYQERRRQINRQTSLF